MRVLGLIGAAAVSALAMSLAVPATAADVLVEFDDIPSSGNIWDGAYFGVHGGMGFQALRYEEEELDEEDCCYSFGLSGWLAGAQAGFNFQEGMWVLGGELDVSAAGIAGENITGGGLVRREIEYNWLASARLKGGVAWENLMVFATVGIGAGGVETLFTRGGDDSDPSHSSP